MNLDLFVPAFVNPAGSPIRELFPYLARPDMISLAGGYPSLSLLDAHGLRTSAQRALALGAGPLQYGATEGTPDLKEQLLLLCASRGITATEQDLLVTTGSQQAFDLLVRLFVQAGDTVLVETPAYPAAIQALRMAGAEMVEVPMDAHGLMTTELARIVDALPPSSRPKLLYTVPAFSNPRGTLMRPSRRAELVELARKHGFLIIEDDPYGEFVFTGDRCEPLHVHGHRLCGADNPVIYLASLSKTVAPALRVGWMVAPPDIVRRCTVAKQTVDLCTSPITQAIAADYLRSGRYAPTVRSSRDEYKRRADTMADSLMLELGGQVHFERPEGGMFLWLESADPLNAQSLFEAAVNQGVLFVPGAAFFPVVPKAGCMRLSFAATDVDQIREGVRRLSRAFRIASKVV
ncbi:PLP-dependent aminotransferase family protein [Comamonadaceae bacterium G21597-S1]|nr:PLP-dependent aminotransferase family protein [Comamonadaceae bacterium G21597-S1]